MWWSGNKPELCGLAVWQTKLEESHHVDAALNTYMPHLNIHKPSAIVLHLYPTSNLQIFNSYPLGHRVISPAQPL